MFYTPNSDFHVPMKEGRVTLGAMKPTRSFPIFVVCYTIKICSLCFTRDFWFYLIKHFVTIMKNCYSLDTFYDFQVIIFLIRGQTWYRLSLHFFCSMELFAVHPVKRQSYGWYLVNQTVKENMTGNEMNGKTYFGNYNYTRNSIKCSFYCG